MKKYNNHNLQIITKDTRCTNVHLISFLFSAKFISLINSTINPLLF